MKRNVVKLLVLFLAVPSLLVACNKSSKPSGGDNEPSQPVEPAHQHSYDDFGFCECGEHQEVEGTVALKNGYYSEPEKLDAGTKKMFKIFAAHAVKASSVYGFKYGAEDIEYEWYDTELHKVKFGTGGDVFAEPSKPTFVYLRLTVDGEAGTKAMSYLKTANKGSTTHSYDEHDHCACGFTDTSSGRHIHYIDRTIDVEPSTMNLVQDEVYSFKAKLYKNHTYKFSNLATYPDKVDVEYYDYTQGQWVVTQFDNGSLDNFNQTNATFTAPMTTDYYMHVKATQSVSDQKAKLNTVEHIYSDFGLDLEDRSYLGTELTVDVESDSFTLAAGAVKYFKWTFTSSQLTNATAWEIAGTSIGATANLVHPEGTWYEVNENTGIYYREKVSDGGYGYHSGKPQAGTYYVRVVNGANAEKTGLKIKVRIHTSA